jgi:hypothetical protein
MSISKKLVPISSDSSATSTIFPMIYHVEVKSRKNAAHNSVITKDVDPKTFHTYVKKVLKEKVGVVVTERSDQLERYLRELTKNYRLVVVDWSLDDVEPTLKDALKASIAAESKPKIKVIDSIKLMRKINYALGRAALVRMYTVLSDDEYNRLVDLLMAGEIGIHNDGYMGFHHGTTSECFTIFKK